MSFSKLWEAGKTGVLQSMGSQRAGHDLATEQQQQFEENSVERIHIIPVSLEVS